MSVLNVPYGVIPGVKLNAELRLNTYAVITRAVEEGVVHGYRRAYKHTDAPNAVQICGAIDAAVLEALCEVLDFGDA